MPTLHWIGKEKVVNHHQEVPFRVLEHKYGFRAEDEENRSETKKGNKIIHGDNLEALKALLPEYEGRIKCIYIDPPYNTGNEKWVYNDNVNDPKIKKWLGEVVGKQGEDLSRHDKWLCMMYPRLKLLHKLLAEEGVIFISIDDIEVSYLKIILDEIWGRNNFIAQLIWKSRQNKDNRNIDNVSVDHEYVLCYGAKLRGCERKLDQYSNPDNDPRGVWVSANMVGLATEKERPNLHYDLIHPNTGVNYGKPNKGWRYDRNTMARLIKENRIIWPAAKSGRPRKKQFLSDLSAEHTGFSSIIGQEFYTSDGTKEQMRIFNNMQCAFPKYSEFVKELIEQATDKESIILDSFAGSGTTAHAVLNLNKKDDGNRKFILIEMEDYAETITAERVRRVAKGYADVAGTGGEFDFYELGMPIFKEDKNLNEEVCEDKIREYIYYTETKQHLERERSENNRYLLDNYNDTGYYFYYEKDQMTTFCLDTLNIITERAEQYVVYADKCLIDEKDLAAKNIVFKKIPRDIKRF